MNIDIRTLIFVLGITHIIQVVVFIHQYLIIKIYRGIGWWLLWSVAEVIGFTFMLLRETPSFRSMAIIGQNSMIVLGVIFLYFGIMRFLDRKVNLAILLPIYAGYVAALMFFLYVHDDIQVRGIIISAALAGFSFLSAQALFVNKPRAISASANFVSAVLMIHGSYFTFRAVAITNGARADNFFTPTMFNVAMFMDALIVAILWTVGFIIMINQRLNAEATEAKEHSELIFNTSPDAALITRLDDGMIVDINNGFTALSGFSREETIGKSSFETNIWKNPADRKKLVGELREKGFRENFEAEFLRKDGSPIFGLMSAKVINLHGLPHIMSVTRDITERKRAEEALQLSYERFQLANRATYNAIWDWDLRTNALWWNENFQTLFGYGAEEIEPSIESWTNRIHPEDLERVRTGIHEAIDSGRHSWSDQYRFRRKDSRYAVVDDRGYIARQADGSPVHMIGAMQDITESKRAEEALRESEAKFRAMVETVPLAIHLSVGVEQISEYVSPTMVKLFGYTLEDIPTIEQWWPLAYPDETYRRRISEEWTTRVKRAIETQTPIEPMETVVTCKDGSKKNISWGYITLGDKNYSCGLDLTERKEAEEDIRRKAKELQEKNDELTRFTYAVSHDLRSPLVTIQTFRGHLEQDLRSQDAARVEKDLGYIRNAADKMSRLLNELLRLSRVGRIMNPPEEAPLQAIVKEALDLGAGRITARGVRVDLTEEPVVLYGDRTRLVEVFMNLVDNAVKFMGDESAPRVEIGVEQAGDEAVLFVRDNGIGIDPQVQSLLFGLFHKLDPGSEGEGVGLALVRRIVELHGGRIWVESEGPGKGTTFRFTLAKTRRGVGRVTPRGDDD
jgi:PAS domain S-box-containing protein